VLLDPAILETTLLGEGVDQKAGWGELLREVANAAAGVLVARSGKNCRVEKFEQFDEIAGESKVSHAFQLKSGERVFTILVCNEVRVSKPAEQPTEQSADAPAAAPPDSLSPGIRLLMDVELEVSLRFGCKELPLGEILDLGPGDVVQLDRNVTDPVDLIVGDKIVACGEVVLVNGNFGLRVTEVASPRKRLESIRCLF
jgi:flagellar motor switch protein FliN